MKKTIILALTFVLAVSLAACGGEPTKPNQPDNGSISDSSTESPSVDSTESPSEDSSEDSSESSSEAPSKPEDSSQASDSSSNASSATNSPETAVSDNIFDNQFLFNQVLITMPTEVKTFEQFDLKLPANKESFMLNPNTFTSGALESSDGEKRIAVGFYNLGSEVIKLSDAMVSSVNLQSKYFGDDTFVFSKGIVLGSTMDEVKAAYGEPTSFIDGDTEAKILRESMVYKNSADSTNHYELYFEDKILKSVQLYVSKK